VEILAALLNGSTLILVAIYIGHEAWQRLRAPPEVLSWPMMAVAAVGLVAQLLTALALGRVQGQSLNVRGAYVHALTDAIQSVGVVLTGLVMVLTGWYLADPIVSVLIGLLMSYSGARIIWDATHVLIEGTPRDVDLGRVAAMMRATPGVLRVTDLHAWTVTSGFNALSAHLEARADLDGAGYEALRSSLVERLRGSFPLHHVTLQIERDCELCRSGCCDWLEEGAGPGHKG
jgi:cobalt-zinc-cadmium efflux system protein